jgi:hypothetical protein
MKSKETEVKLLQLKFLVEGLEVIGSQHTDGTKDLHFRLSHFRKRIKKTDLKKFDKFFFGKSLEGSTGIVDKSDEIVLQDNKAQTVVTQNNEKINHPAWLKKIYRKIVQSTHPDKFENFPVESIKRKYTKIYMKTVAAWENQEYDIVLLCAYEADVDYDNRCAEKYVTQGINARESKIKNIKKTMAYSWHHVQLDQRAVVLENYLRKLGYAFTKEEVELVVNLARKRKPGTRPEKIRQK